MSYKSFLDEVFADDVQPSSGGRFARFGLTRNPFPGHEEEFFAFIEGQDEAKSLFRDRLAEFSRTRIVSSVVAVADHRVGKTNFLRHYHSRMTGAFEHFGSSSGGGHSPRLLPFYTNAYEYDFFFLYRQLVDHIPDSLILELAGKLSVQPLRGVGPETDLTRALLKLGQDWNTSGFNRQGRVELFKRWLRGGYRSLNSSSRSELGVHENIGNSPIGTRFLRDLTAVFYDRGVLDGWIIFLDEFERLVGAGVSRSQRDRYLNDVRNCLSDFQSGAFFCFAITPAALQELQQLYPAIPPRLGTQLRLSPILSEEDALSFASRYLDYFRGEAKGRQRELLTRERILNVYLRLRPRYIRGVPQGQFLSSLRDEAEQAAAEE